MPSHKELLRLLREDKTPHQIVRMLQMRPSQWRRMIGGKRFQDALAIKEQLAAIMAAHDIASGVHTAAERLTELLASDKPETVRKVALALLHEGLTDKGQKHRPAPQAAWLRPWDSQQLEHPLEWLEDEEPEEETEE